MKKKGSYSYFSAYFTESFRYYVINPEKTMLDNTRNRVIVDHPKIIVILGTECFNMTVSLYPVFLSLSSDYERR